MSEQDWTQRGWIVVDEQNRIVFDGRRQAPKSVFESYFTNASVPVEEQARRIDLAASAPDLLRVLQPFVKLYHEIVGIYGTQLPGQVMVDLDWLETAAEEVDKIEREGS